MNRISLMECNEEICGVGDRCTNRRFQNHCKSDCIIFETENKGFGLAAKNYIPIGQFIMEYVGEVLDKKQFKERSDNYARNKITHEFFMTLSHGRTIDATKKGNISRFINHSCDPNAESQTWFVDDEWRIGIFAIKPISPNEEITFNYFLKLIGQVSNIYE